MTDNNLHGLALPPPGGRGNTARPPGAPLTPPSTAPGPARAPAPAPEPAPAPTVDAVPQPGAPAAADPPAPIDATAAALQARITALETLLAAERDRGGAPWAGHGAIASLEAPAPKDSPRKVVLPDIVPGFKANALDSVIPPRVDQAFAAFHYVPYTALSRSARSKALSGDAEVVITNGTLVAKGLDKSGEASISILEWIDAAAIAVRRTRVFHGDARAHALEEHHKVVSQLGATYGWPVAVQYDIQQRGASASVHTHDLSTLDEKALTLAIGKVTIAAANAASATVSHQPGPST
ncbi:hypothetical protein BJ912DRAFT_83878 [Pholiota molesta]|nr:hypothetical protein BJ912DRAFT_83878 [Pholiota molesta]